MWYVTSVKLSTILQFAIKAESEKRNAVNIYHILEIYIFFNWDMQHQLWPANISSCLKYVNLFYSSQLTQTDAQEEK